MDMLLFIHVHNAFRTHSVPVTLAYRLLLSLIPCFSPTRPLYILCPLPPWPNGFNRLAYRSMGEGYSQEHGRLTRCYTSEENESPSSSDHPLLIDPQEGVQTYEHLPLPKGNAGRTNVACAFMSAMRMS